MEKISEVYRINNNEPKILACGNSEIGIEVSWVVSIDNKRYSNTHRAEPPLENARMVAPIKGCTEMNLHAPSLLPIQQCTLQCMGFEQKCITGTQTFPISKLRGWKLTTAFSKSSKTNRHQELQHLRGLDNTDVIEIGRLLAREEHGETFEIGVTLASLQKTRKLPRRTSRRNTTQDRGPNISRSLKNRKQTQ